jgi:hypothetical protein
VAASWFRVVAVSNTSNDGRVLKTNGGISVTVVAVSNTSNKLIVSNTDEIIRGDARVQEKRKWREDRQAHRIKYR